MAQGIKLTEARVLRVEPGDVVAVITKHQVSAAGKTRIREQLREVWPDNDCLVLSAADLAVLRPAESPAES